MKRIEKDPLQKKLEITNWILLALMIAGSLLLFSPRFSLGIILGGLISVVNFHWLYHNLLSVFEGEINRLRSAIMRRYFIRLAVTAVSLFGIIAWDIADVIGLVVGLSVVVLTIVLTTVLTLCQKNCAEEL
ncbi:MAG: ATP synthase subunit I [Proteobacteria bacterium]|nr:ATP synthase subunit I [Pseudomonadota bacterium]